MKQLQQSYCRQFICSYDQLVFYRFSFGLLQSGILIWLSSTIWSVLAYQSHFFTNELLNGVIITTISQHLPWQTWCCQLQTWLSWTLGCHYQVFGSSNKPLSTKQMRCTTGGSVYWLVQLFNNSLICYSFVCQTHWFRYVAALLRFSLAVDLSVEKKWKDFWTKISQVVFQFLHRSYWLCFVDRWVLC